MVLETSFPQNSSAAALGNTERRNSYRRKKLPHTEQCKKTSINSPPSDPYDNKCETFMVSIRDISLKSIKCQGLESLSVEEGKERTTLPPRKKIPFQKSRIYLSLENEGKTVLVSNTTTTNEKAPQIAKIPSNFLLEGKENQMALWGSHSSDKTQKSKSPKNMCMEEEISHDDSIISPSGFQFNISLQTEFYSDEEQSQENVREPSMEFSTKVLKINVGILSQGQSILIGTTDLVITGDTLKSKILDLPIRTIEPKKKGFGLKRVIPRSSSFKNKKQNGIRLLKGVSEYFKLSTNPTLRVCLDIRKPTPMPILHYDMSIEENETFIKESFGESFDTSGNEGIEILHSFNQITILSSFSKKSDVSEGNQDDDPKDSAPDENSENDTLNIVAPNNIIPQTVPLKGTRTNNSSFSYALCMAPSSQDLEEPVLHKFSSISKDTTSLVGSNSETSDENENTKNGHIKDNALNSLLLKNKRTNNSTLSHGLCMTPSIQDTEEPPSQTFDTSLKDSSTAVSTVSDKDRMPLQNKKCDMIDCDTSNGSDLASQTFGTNSDDSSISVATETNDENLNQNLIHVSISKRLDMKDKGQIRSDFGLCMGLRDIQLMASSSSDSTPGDDSESSDLEINENENSLPTNDNILITGNNNAITKSPHPSNTFDISEDGSMSVATDINDENLLNSNENLLQDKQNTGISGGIVGKDGGEIRSPFGLCMDPRDIQLLASYSSCSTSDDDEESENTGLDSNTNCGGVRAHSLPLQSIQIPTENVIAMIKKNEIKIVQIGGNQPLEKGEFRFMSPSSLQDLTINSSSTSECEMDHSDYGASTVNTEDVKIFLCNSSSSSESWDSTDDEKNSTE